MASHRIRFRVYYEDTDAGGIVYHARYLAFAERARTEAVRSTGLSVARLADEGGLYFVVRKAALTFKSPLRLDDEMTVVTTLEGQTPTRLLLKQVFENASGGDHVCTIAQIELACVEAASLRPGKIPPEWSENIRKLAEEGV